MDAFQSFADLAWPTAVFGAQARLRGLRDPGSVSVARRLNSHSNIAGETQSNQFSLMAAPEVRPVHPGGQHGVG
jgi:hypothetical protein